MRVPATATQNVQVVRHAGGAWSCAGLPGGLDSASTLVIACGTGTLKPDSGPVHELRGVFRSSAMIGCSTSWLGCGSGHDEVTALVWKMNKTRLSLASAPLRGVSDSFRAGQLLGQQLMTPSLRAMLVLADGGKTNGSQFLRGLHNVVGEQVHVMGGLSSHLPESERHWVLRSGVPADGFVSAVGFYGSALKITQQCVCGWTGVGPQRRISRARDCTVHELDGCPAWEVYRAYLGAQDNLDTARRLPLAVRIGEHTTIRTVRHVDEATGAMTFGGDMPEAASAQLVFAPRHDCDMDSDMDSGTDSGSAATAPANGVQLTCIGAARLHWSQALPATQQDEATTAELTRIAWAMEGEFCRRTGGGTEMHGGSITTMMLTEEGH